MITSEIICCRYKMEKYLNTNKKRINQEVNTTEDDTNDYVVESSKSSENEIESLKIQKYYKILSVEGHKNICCSIVFEENYCVF